MNPVRSQGKLIGNVEQTNGGAWFAEVVEDHVTWTSAKGIGAFPTRALAMKAIADWHDGEREFTGQIKPQFIIGGPPHGMTS